MLDVLKKIDFTIEKVSSWLLVLIVLLMLFLSSGSIVLRWFQFHLPWIDPLVRHLVFFSAFLGGVIATGKGTHIGIDLVGKFIESLGYHKMKKLVDAIVFVSSIAVLFWMIKAGIDFTKVEMEFSKEEFLGTQSGYLVMLIPIGLSLLNIRFIIVFLLRMFSVESKR